MSLNDQLHKTLSTYMNNSQVSTASHSKLIVNCQELLKEVKKKIFILKTN